MLSNIAVIECKFKVAELSLVSSLLVFQFCWANNFKNGVNEKKYYWREETESAEQFGFPFYHLRAESQVWPKYS